MPSTPSLLVELFDMMKNLMLQSMTRRAKKTITVKMNCASSNFYGLMLPWMITCAGTILGWKPKNRTIRICFQEMNDIEHLFQTNKIRRGIKQDYCDLVCNPNQPVVFQYSITKKILRCTFSYVRFNQRGESFDVPEDNSKYSHDDILLYSRVFG